MDPLLDCLRINFCQAEPVGSNMIGLRSIVRVDLRFPSKPVISPSARDLITQVIYCHMILAVVWELRAIEFLLSVLRPLRCQLHPYVR